MAEQGKGTPLNVEAEWPSSQGNPFNWRLAKRVYHAVLPALFGLVV